MNESERFDAFMLPLKETHFSLKDYVDFTKVVDNIDKIAVKLNQLNYLIGQPDMLAAVRLLWDENPKAFSALDILIAVRSKDNKKALGADGRTRSITDYFTSPERVAEFLNETGLTAVLQSKQIKNLVDYAFGVEVGLDSNARKNRGGHLMEDIVVRTLEKSGIKYEQEVSYTEFPEVVKALGKDKKRFDFVVRTADKIYLIETNFYAGGGSKLNEVARAYSELSPRINAVPGFEFVWITDGIGWNDARTKLQEAFFHVDYIYNLSTIQDFVNRIKG